MSNFEEYKKEVVIFLGDFMKCWEMGYEKGLDPLYHRAATLLSNINQRKPIISTISSPVVSQFGFVNYLLLERVSKLHSAKINLNIIKSWLLIL